MCKKETILVTSALPYANGPIHFGHIAGAYLPADIFVRFKKLYGADIVYVSGTDEHGFAITVSAQQEGNTPKKHVDHYNQVIQDIFKKFNVEFDNFSRTSLKHHYKLSQEFFTNLHKANKISEKTTDQLYCKSCNMFLADRYVTGGCPHCEYEEARGDECPKCGNWIEATELKDPKCKVCCNTPVVKQTKHWFLDLGKFSDTLKTWIDSKKNWKPNVTNFISAMIEQGLESRPITRDMDWGIPVPLEDAKGKVLYVWFDAPIGYISSTMEWAEKKGEPDKWKDYWHNKDCRLVHFIGKDNLPFHCVVWPAVLMGQSDYILPTDVPANEFYNLEGKQFSKSTGWYVDLDGFFNKFQSDSIRYVIGANAPETKDSAFSWKDFQNKHNGDLADTLGNLVNRALKFTASYFDNTVPEASVLSEADHTLLKKIKETFTTLENLYDTYQVRRVCYEIMELARVGNRYFDEQAPWSSRKTDITKCAATMNCTIQLVKAIALAAYPVIPDAAQKMWHMLGYSHKIKSTNWLEEKLIQVPAGQALGTAEVLFSKIDDKVIEEEIEKLNKMVSDEAEATKEKNVPKITFEEFQKIKLKIAEILKAEPVKKSKKLMKLEVSLGKEQRQIIAGIKEGYSDPEKLIGKKVIVVSNLKTAKLMGLESQGMLLAAHDDTGLHLITPDSDAKPGSEVK
ncbi:MAG: methionine--tRNA ligase [Fibrobacteria bacterium]|nr:methionine--tRNA ligase [Fibrobacteria bacterium]